ncbi:MAG: septum formation initiator family protein [Rhodospirillales bacterium]|nr:septum formation initiator family protein [Rhodospirillales bacterium]
MLGFCAVGYFVYHSIEGDRGLMAYVRLSGEIAQAQAQLDELAAERGAMERRVSLLRSDRLDPDMLEERARRVLNFARTDEIVIVDPPPGAR